jgi:predicted enzyme related to lactoylglutathione lyase
MRNVHGSPVWYELMTSDPDASKVFYDGVVGWTIEGRPAGEMDYRIIVTPGGDNAGGVLGLTDDMVAQGMKPRWLLYIGVDDVDATVEAIRAKGGAIHMGPIDAAGVGRFAMVADPQGNDFYVMRGLPDEKSTAFDRMGLAKCNWNELATSDQVAGNAFYADVFGWTYPDKMEMPGDMGDYVFVAVDGETIGATMKASQPGQPTGWQFYFRTPDIEVAADSVRRLGGAVLMGPQEVPGGDRIIVASDPHGVVVGFVGPGEGA